MSLFDGSRLAALDTETTGFDPAQGHRVIEVACVPLDDGRIGEPWSRLVRPGRPIPREATAIHGITDEMVRDAPGAAEVAAELEERVAGRVLVFHNAAFDLPFLAVFMREAGRPPLLNPVVDTLGLARGLFGEGRNPLGVLAARLGLPPETAHRAGGDALTTARVLLELGGQWEGRKGARSVAELAAASQDVMRLTSRRPRA